MADPAPAAAPAPAGGSPGPGGPEDRDPVIVRGYPKVIFFWPLWLMSLVGGLVAGDAPGGHLGTVWMCIFAFNLLVIAFDFTELVSLLVLALVGLLVFAGLYFDFLPLISDFFRNLDVYMNRPFYVCIFGLFSIFYAAVFVKTRFDYWEFRHNEVLHRRGIFADIKRYSTEDLRWFKETPDVLERLLADSGRIVLTTPREPNPIVIDNVLRISKADEEVADILGTKRVTLK
ncbi:MAG: hypothetical protein ACKOSS_03660 [Planctomycetia bacterium]